MKSISKLLKIALLLSLVPLLLGFLQAHHPLFDSFSHFRYHILVLIASLLILLVIFDKSRLLFGGLSIVTVAYIYIFPLTYGSIAVAKSGHGMVFSHMQFNLNFRNKKIDSILELLSNKKPDIVTMQEVTNAHRAKLETLKRSGLYPYQTYCDFYPVVGGVAILSRHPISNIACAKRKGLVSAHVDINGTQINAVSLHLHWPYPYAQYAQVNDLKPFLNSLNSTKYRLISGDFNAATWSNIVKSIAKESNTNVVGGLRWTIGLDNQLFFIPFTVKLPIDQLLLHGMHAEKSVVLKHYGSDHYPIFTTLKTWDKNPLLTH